MLFEISIFVVGIESRHEQDARTFQAVILIDSSTGVWEESRADERPHGDQRESSLVAGIKGNGFGSHAYF